MAKRGVKGRPASFGTSSRFQVRFFNDENARTEVVDYQASIEILDITDRNHCRLEYEF